MLENIELNQNWDDSESFSVWGLTFDDFSSEALLWDGLDTYLDQACMAVLE